MKGARCEVECEDDTDCGHGTCDTSVGRCVCTQKCYNDIDCPKGSTCDTSTLQCLSGWTDIQCGTALDSTCTTDDDCGVDGGFGHGGTCGEDGTCVCDPGFVGYRCERELVKDKETCTTNTECAAYNDTCKFHDLPEDRACHPNCDTDFTGRACGVSGKACTEDDDCNAFCVDNTCTTLSDAPELSEEGLLKKIEDVGRGLLSPESIAEMAIEEALEYAVRISPSLIRKMILASAKRSATVVPMGMQVKQTAMASVRKAMVASYKKIAKTAIGKAMKNLAAGAIGLGPLASLFFAIQVIGLVLDINDSAGFSAQIPQEGVDMYMMKMIEFVNDMPQLKDIGIRFPREYLPHDTLEWAVATTNEVVEDTRTALMKDYIDRLAINSNGDRIVTTWKDPERTLAQLEDLPEKRPNSSSVAMVLANNNVQVATRISKWWWILVLLGALLILTLTLGLVFSRKRRRRNV